MRYIIVMAVVGLLAILIVATVKSSIEENKAWIKFKLEHHCRIVGKKQSQTSIGTATVVRPDGSVSVAPVTSTTPGQTAWECDDGVTYWRNN